MSEIEKLARAAGFRKAGEISTATDPEKVAGVGGIDIVSDPIMPEGMFALRSDKGALCVGPKGTFWVPFFDPEEFANRPIALRD